MSINNFVVTLVNEEHYTSKKKITFTVVKNYLLSKNRNTYKTVRMNICCWLCSWEILWNKKELKKPIYLPMCPVAATLNDCMRRWLICNDVMWTWKYMLFCHIDFTLFQCLLVMMTCSVLSLCLLLLWVNHCFSSLEDSPGYSGSPCSKFSAGNGFGPHNGKKMFEGESPDQPKTANFSDKNGTAGTQFTIHVYVSYGRWWCHIFCGAIKINTIEVAAIAF